MTSPAVSAPSFEHLPSSLGIGVPAPRISFKVAASPGWEQSAYEIEVKRADIVSSSGRRQSPECVLVEWPFEVLRSRERAEVRVRVWGPDGGASEWSPTAVVEAGLLEATDWTATPISAGWDDLPDEDVPPPLLRREFDVQGPVKTVRLYATAHGLYEAEINGIKVGDDAFAPGWTSYDHRLRYYTFDVTDLITEGPNAIGAWLADGWYRGRLGFHGGRRNRYGHRLALLAQLEIEYADGRRDTIGTERDWRSATGPILMSSLYDGETYDARSYPAGWSMPGFDDTSWRGVRSEERDMSTLVAPQGPPVRCTQTVKPVEVSTSPSGKTILDFGQNLVGRLRITVEGREGDQVTLRHAEVLQDGELCTRPMRFARATDVYVLAGDGEETWEPRFTFHGFRYAEVTGWTGGDIETSIEARVYHTDMPRLGHFESSDPLLNRLHHSIEWSMRGNFLDIPTDCPQRDERLGWTGDIQVFASTAAFLYDCVGMLASWLKDVAADQLPDGTVPWYVPYIDTTVQWSPPQPGAVWGDVVVLTPLDLYQSSGDRQLLAEGYPAAKKWIDLVDSLAGPSHIVEAGYQLGDWLDPAAPPEDPAAGLTDRYLVATAYFAWSTRELARMASILGLDEDADTYTRLADEVRAAFIDRYGKGSGRLSSDTQTAYALGICFELIPEDQRDRAGQRLADLVASANNRIATGFVGTPLVTRALALTNQYDAAYALLLERECPSWLYTILQGGTTTWERWDSMLPDGSINPGEMTSFNHYALGAVGNWLHTTVAGIEASSPGYRTIRFRPRPGGGLTSASARHETPYGTAAISWTLDAHGQLSADVTVPTGTVGQLELLGQEPRLLSSGTHRIGPDTDGTRID